MRMEIIKEFDISSENKTIYSKEIDLTTIIDENIFSNIVLSLKFLI